MNIFKELRNMYDEINNYYAKKEFEARKKGWHGKEKLWSRKRQLNDWAYFLFAFTRLEGRIRERSSELIDKKQRRLRNWQLRSAWDILPKEKKSNIYFKNRLALLIPKESDDYNNVVAYYDKLRNPLGHGDDLNPSIYLVIPIVLNDFEILYYKTRTYTRIPMTSGVILI